MADARIGGAVVELSAKVDPFEHGMNRASKRMKSFSAESSKLALAMAAGGAGMVVAQQVAEKIGDVLAIAAKGAGAFARSVQESAKDVDRLNDAAFALGATTESLSRLEYAATMSGAEFDAVSGGATKLMRAIESSSKSVTGLGVNMAELRRASPEEQLSAVADAILRLPGPTARVAAAMDLFGKSGAGMLPFLLQGSKGIAELTKEADVLGLTLNGLDAEKVAQANDSIDRMKFSLRAAGRVLAVEVAPFIEKGATELSGFVAAAGGAKGIILPVIEKIGQAGAFAADAMQAARAEMQMMGTIGAGLASAIMHPLDPLAGPKAAKSQMELAMQTARAETYSSRFNKWMIGVSNASDKAAQESVKMKDSLRGASEYAESLEGSIDKTVQKMGGFGALSGAGGADTGMFKTFERDSRAMTEAMKTPMEKYTDELTKVDRLEKVGMITAMTAQRARAAAFDAVQPKASAFAESLNESVKALGDLGRGQEVDLGALATGATLISRGGMADAGGAMFDLGTTFGGHTAGGATFGGTNGNMLTAGGNGGGEVVALLQSIARSLGGTMNVNFHTSSFESSYL